MEQMKKWIASILIVATFSFTGSPLQADDSCCVPAECCEEPCPGYVGGDCYTSYCQRPPIGAGIALTAVAAAAIIAVAVQRSNNNHGHS